MDFTAKAALTECEMGDVANLNVVAQFLVDFFDDIEKYQGRMMKRDRCRVAKKACWKILSAYNGLGIKYNDLVKSYEKLLDEVNTTNRLMGEVRVSQDRIEKREAEERARREKEHEEFVRNPPCRREGKCSTCQYNGNGCRYMHLSDGCGGVTGGC